VSDRRALAWHGALGLALGFGLNRVGFSDFAEVNRMFALGDVRLVATFAGALVVVAAGLALAGRRSAAAHHPWHPGLVAGGLLFGAGWALCGACPSIALVRLGEGDVAIVWTLLGLAVGTWLYGPAHRRWFRWDPGSCE
jgi:uncharacterized protein